MTRQKNKIIPWYRMLWFVQSQNPSETIDLLCPDT